MKECDTLPKTELYSNIKTYAEKNPDKPAVYDASGNFVTYNDIITVYDNLRLFLEKNSVKPFERISIITHDEIIAGMLSIPVFDNSVLLPVDLELPEERIKYFYNLLDADYVISDDMTCASCRIAEELGMGIIHFKSDKERKKVEFKLASILKKDHTPEKKEKSDFVKISTTSGTTSTPKIVPITASEYNVILVEGIKLYNYTADDNILILSRIFKGYTTSTLFRILSVGGTVVFAGGFNHSDLFNLIKTYRITVFSTIPAVLSSFMKYIESNNLDFNNSSLRFILSAGASLSKQIKEYVESVFHTPLIDSYGMTEVGVISSTYKAPNGYKEGSVGLSFLLDVKIVDNEILVKGDTVFGGYENADVNNDDCFTDGWFHTGDTGYIDSEGYIFITGRIKEMINRGGEKVSPYEVENTILNLDFVNDVAVFPYPDSYGSENVGAVIVLAKGSNMGIKQLRKLLKGKLPIFKMPKILFVAEEIPKSDNNKVQRKLLYGQLKEKYPIEGYDSSEKKDLVLTKTEKEVRRIWKNTLKIKNPALNDTFTELGGDSIDGAVVLSVIESRLNIRIPVDMLFENGTIKYISHFIDNEAKENSQFKFLVPIKVTGSKKPLVCIHSGTGDAVTYRHIGKYMDEDRPVYALRFDAKKINWPQPLEFKDLSREYAEEIIRMNPDGPYFLCGHCWGGVLAFSIASELVKNGNKVSLLAMLDSAPKTAPDDKRKPDPERHLALGNVISKSLKNLMKLPFKNKVKYIIRKISNIGNLIKLKFSGRIYNYGIANNRPGFVRLAGKTGMLTSAYNRYRPNYYDGKVIYFKTTGNSGRTAKFPDYWKSMTADFERVDIKCAHNDIVVGADAKILVKKLEILMRIMDV